MTLIKDEAMAAKPKRSLIPFFLQWLRETGSCGGLIASCEKKKNGGRRYLSVRLNGINPCIHLSVSSSEVNIAVYFHRECYDFLQSIDIDVRINEDGKYYCAQCPPDEKAYDSEYELCVRHSFEPVREYLQSIALPEKCLVLRYKVNSYSEAQVINKAKLSSMDKEHVAAVFDILDTQGINKLGDFQ